MRRALFAALLVLANPAWSQSTPEHTPGTKPPHKQRRAEASKPTPPAPPITLAQGKALVQEQSTKSDQANALENAAINRRIRDFTGVLAVVGLIQIVFIWLGFKLTKQAADAATASAEVARKTMQITSMARLKVGPVTIREPFEVGKAPAIAIVVTNMGQATATVTSRTIVVRIQEEELADVPVLGKDPAVMPVIHGGSNFGFYPELPAWTREDLRSIQQETLKFFIFGRLEYSDVFGQHAVGFGVQYDPRRETIGTDQFAAVSTPGYSYDEHPEPDPL